MGMFTKSTVRLDQIVVHDAQYTKVLIGKIVVFGKRKVKARLEPIGMGPGGVRGWIGAIAKPTRVGFGHVELVVGDNLDGGSHGGA